MKNKAKASQLRYILRDTRIERGLRQLDVAQILGKPQSYVAKIESGERQVGFTEALAYCRAIELDPVELITLLDDPSQLLGWTESKPD